MCVCALHEHFQCICGGSRLAGTSLANCYRNNNISIMYSNVALCLYISGTIHSISAARCCCLSVTKGESIFSGEYKTTQQRWLRWKMYSARQIVRWRAQIHSTVNKCNTMKIIMYADDSASIKMLTTMMMVLVEAFICSRHGQRTHSRKQ